MKKLISYIIRKVPRKYLQRVSHYVLPLVAVFLKGKKYHCPVCGHEYRKMLPYGRKARANALCPNCLSLERHRLLWLYLDQKTTFLKQPAAVLHIAPEVCFKNRFKKVHGQGYITGDIESPLADVKMDVHNIPFEDNRFDNVFCNHVMEHVESDLKAMQEIYRVLKPGGWAIIQSPQDMSRETTFEDPTITDPKAREEAYWQSDHVRLYGRDYGQRLRQAGFEVTEDNFVQTLTPEEQQRYSLPTEEIIYFCRKAL